MFRRLFGGSKFLKKMNTLMEIYAVSKNPEATYKQLLALEKLIRTDGEQVGELFEKEMGTEKGNFDPTYLTHAARKNLRNIFLNAEAAMTGANFAVASTGDIVVCTNEGNADMTRCQIHQLQDTLTEILWFVPMKEMPIWVHRARH